MVALVDSTERRHSRLSQPHGVGRESVSLSGHVVWAHDVCRADHGGAGADAIATARCARARVAGADDWVSGFKLAAGWAVRSRRVSDWRLLQAWVDPQHDACGIACD